MVSDHAVRNLVLAVGIDAGQIGDARGSVRANKSIS